MMTTNEDLAPIAALDGWGMAKPDKKLTLPSGAVVRVKSLSIPDLISLDILDKMDSFTPKVLEGGKKKKVKDTSELKPEQLLDLMEALDKIAVKAVSHPKLTAEPEPNEDGTPGEELEGVRYVHHIPLPDKMMIFENAFEGMEEFFRLGGKPSASLGAVETVEGASPVTE